MVTTRNRLAQTANELEHIFNQVFGPTLTRGENFVPSANIAETDTDFQVTLEVPGVKLEAINVEFTDDQLRVSGEKAVACDESAKTCHCSERRSGKFQRTFRFPTDVNPEKIEARLENGLLMIRLPKAEQVLPRKIQVKVSD
jgi:HSP20 family protein